MTISIGMLLTNVSGHHFADRQSGMGWAPGETRQVTADALDDDLCSNVPLSSIEAAVSCGILKLAI